MDKLCFFFALAILSSGVFGLNFKNKLLAEDKEDLEDRFGWNKPNRPNRPSGGRSSLFPCQFPVQFPGQCQLQQPTPTAPTTAPTPSVNGATKQSVFNRKCMLTCPVTFEFYPVCGSNGVTYSNPSSLNCDKTCGVDVYLVSYSPCSTTTVPTAPTTVPTPSVSRATTQSTFVRDCIRTCPVTAEFNPVCGSNGVTYDNRGRLSCAQACGVDVYLVSYSPCSTTTVPTAPTTVPTPSVSRATTQSTFVRDCIRTCPVTAEFNPVCGSNGVTYDNRGRLSCAQACGVDVYLVSYAPCSTTTVPTAPTTVPTPSVSGATTQSTFVRDCIRTCPVTAEFNPVCGSNGVTYDNRGRLSCAQACGVDVYLLRSSPCPTTTVAPTS